MLIQGTETYTIFLAVFVYLIDVLRILQHAVDDRIYLIFSYVFIRVSFLFCIEFFVRASFFNQFHAHMLFIFLFVPINSYGGFLIFFNNKLFFLFLYVYRIHEIVLNELFVIVSILIFYQIFLYISLSFNVLLQKIVFIILVDVVKDTSEFGDLLWTLIFGV